MKNTRDKKMTLKVKQDGAITIEEHGEPERAVYATYAHDAGKVIDRAINSQVVAAWTKKGVTVRKHKCKSGEPARVA